MTIRTGEQFYHPVPGSSGHAEAVVRTYWPAGIPFALPLGTADVALKAEVNYSRWMVMCPECSSAQHACETDRRFLCTECLNGWQNGLWIPVEWPPDDLRAEIEAILLERSSPANRIWKPGVLRVRHVGWVGPAETLEQLRAENEVQGSVPAEPGVFAIPGVI